MNITIPKKELLRLVARCQGVADKKSPMPALSHVLLDAHDGTLRVAATDLYIGIESSTACETRTAGTVALPARDLFERVKSMPDGSVTLDVDAEAHATLKAVGAPRRHALHGIPGGEYPKIATAPVDGSPTLVVPVGMLATLLAQTEFSASTDEMRAFVNAVLIEWMGGTLRAVSTDTHRLSRSEATLGGKTTGTMLVSLKTVRELRRLLESVAAETADVAIVREGPSAFFKLGDATLSTKLIDAQFPPYQQVIPATDSMNAATVPRAALADAVRAVSLGAGRDDKDGSNMGVRITLERAKLTIEASSKDGGPSRDELAIMYEGEPTIWRANDRYLLEVLAALDSDEVKIFCGGSLDPIVIVPHQAHAERSFLGVLMPMRM